MSKGSAASIGWFAQCLVPPMRKARKRGLFVVRTVAEIVLQCSARRAKHASERRRPWCDQATISCAATTRPDAWLVEQRRCERAHVAEQFALELVGFVGRCLDSQGEAA
jgi:hypothetical protein